MRRKTWTLFVCFAALGCNASVVHEPATDAGTGIRYYESAPYLIIYSNGTGGLRWQIKYLPDQTRMMMASPTISGAHADMALSFQNGVLTTASAAGDTTEIPKALIATVQSSLPLLLGARENITEPPQIPNAMGFPAPYLYKLEVNGDKVTFIGGQGKTRIQVPINRGAAP